VIANSTNEEFQSACLEVFEAQSPQGLARCLLSQCDHNKNDIIRFTPEDNGEHGDDLVEENQESQEAQVDRGRLSTTSHRAIYLGIAIIVKMENLWTSQSQATQKGAATSSSRRRLIVSKREQHGGLQSQKQMQICKIY